MKKIYLDTYDYSTIIKSQNPNIFYEKIRSLKKNGHLFYFSSISITETRPDTTAKNKDLIYRHAKAIENICESNPLIHFLELFEIEKQSLKTKELFDHNLIYSADNWIHSKIKEDLLKDNNDYFNKIFNDSTNRAARRNKKQNQKLIKQAIINNFSTNSSINNLIGFEYFKRSIINCQELNLEILVELFIEFINSPVNSVMLFTQNKINNFEFSEWLTGSANLYKNELIEKLKSNKSASYNEKEFEKELIISIIRSLTNEKSNSIEEYKKYCKGIYCMSKLISKVLIESIKQEKPRKAKASDFGDFLNSCYTPYLDKIRIDNYMYEKMKDFEYKDIISTGDLLNFLDSVN